MLLGSMSSGVDEAEPRPRRGSAPIGRPPRAPQLVERTVHATIATTARPRGASLARHPVSLPDASSTVRPGRQRRGAAMGRDACQFAVELREAVTITNESGEPQIVLTIDGLTLSMTPPTKDDPDVSLCPRRPSTDVRQRRRLHPLEPTGTACWARFGVAVR